MTTPQDNPLPGQMDPSIQRTRRSTALKWNDYLLTDLDPSDEGWEMSMVLKELAEKYQAYDETPHAFGDGYNIRWKRYFVLVFQVLLKTLPQGTVALEQAIEMLERPEAPDQVGPAIIKAVPNVEPANANAANINAAKINSAAMVKVNSAANGNSTVNAGNVNVNANANNTANNNNNNNNSNSKKRPAEAMDQNDDNNHDALHPSKRVMTTHQNYPALPPGTIFKVDTQSAYKVRITEGATPTFKFKSSGPARVQVKLNHGGAVAPVGGDAGVLGAPGSAAIAASGAQAPATAAAAAPVPTCGVPGPAATPNVANPLGTAMCTSLAPAPDSTAASGALATSSTIAGPGTVVPAAPDPAPAVVAFASRASLAASGGVDNVNPTSTGWEGMGWEDMGFEEWSSVSSMSSNTDTDSDIA